MIVLLVVAVVVLAIVCAVLVATTRSTIMPGPRVCSVAFF